MVFCWFVSMLQIQIMQKIQNNYVTILRSIYFMSRNRHLDGIERNTQDGVMHAQSPTMHCPTVHWMSLEKFVPLTAGKLQATKRRKVKYQCVLATLCCQFCALLMFYLNQTSDHTPNSPLTAVVTLNIVQKQISC